MIITVSRQYATNGILIARMVAERLGARVFDRELIEQLAARLSVHEETISNLYQAVTDPVHTAYLEWRNAITPQMYVRALQSVLKKIADEGGNAVIVGRGANFVLRGANTLHVRIVAPIELRTAIFRAGNDISEAEARHIITKRDQERAHFVKAAFHHEIEDSKHYDMILNLHGITPETATELILLAAAARKTQPVSADPEATMPSHLEIMVKARHHVRPEIVDRNNRRK